MCAEGIFLALRRQRTGAGPTGIDLASVLLPGAFLVLALRAALTSASAISIAAFLSAALLAHILDMRRRLR